MAKNPTLPSQKMHRENFELALTLAIEAQAGHEFHIWKMTVMNNPKLESDKPPESPFLKELREILRTSLAGQEIEIVSSPK